MCKQITIIKAITATGNQMSSKGFTEQKLNLTIALCAVLISIASFYATYIQASAAEQQVKAMTLPLLQYTPSNLTAVTHEPVVSFAIKNGGVGPALIKSLSFSYKKEKNLTFQEFLNTCCESELLKFTKVAYATMDVSKGGNITSTVVNTILPAQEEVHFYKLFRGEFTSDLWLKVNNERFELGVEICYCSLLDNCYLTDGRGNNKAIEVCPVIIAKR